MAIRGRSQSGGAFSNVLVALLLTTLIFSAAVVFVLNFKWLYYLDITLLGIERQAGMSVAKIKANYDALFQYNQFWNQSKLVFPTLAMSATGRIHFEEVKEIFVAIQFICIGAFATSLLGVIVKTKNKQYGYLKLTGIFTLLIPAVLGALAAWNWEQFFVTFHHLFFKNDYWIFDPKTDPIILLLPDGYFLHCAIMILVFIVLGSLICFLLYRRHRKRRKVKKTYKRSRYE